MTSLPDDCCANCVFYRDDEPEKRQGACVRFPPTVIVIEQWNASREPYWTTESSWPTTYDAQWCGEHKRAEVEP